MANKLTQLVTPNGEILYPHLMETETYNGEDTGNYTVTLKFSKEDTDKIIDKLEQEWDKAYSSGEFAGKPLKKGTAPNLGSKEDKNGDIVFKAKTKAEIKTKTGAIMKRTVAIFDAKGKATDVKVGHGSIGKASLSLSPYYASSVNYGVSLYLNGLQIIDLKEPGSYQDATSMGFSEEEGFSSEELDKEATAIGFDSDNADF